jgi:hypothetical protein
MPQTGISPNFTIRKEGQDVPTLSPSGGGLSAGISKFSQGINPVQAQQVQFGSPYVATQQSANFLTSLGQFNDGVNRFAGAFGKYTNEKETLQGEADSATMAPEERARLFNEFKGNVDAATKAGILPKAMHPAYRMALMEGTAKTQTVQELGDVLNKRRDELTDAGATNIGQQLSMEADKYLNEKYQDPLSRMSAGRAAQQIVMQTTSSFETKRNANFDTKLEEVHQVDTKQNFNTIAAALSDPNTPPEMLSSLYAQVGTPRKGDGTPNETFSKNLEAYVSNAVESKQLSVEDAYKLTVGINKNVSGGTGKWADTLTGQQTLGKLNKFLQTQATSNAELNIKQRNDDEKQAATTAEASINEFNRNGNVLTSENREVLKAQLKQQFPHISDALLGLKIDDANRAVNAAADSEKANPNMIKAIDDLTVTNPKQAKALLSEALESKVITYNTFRTKMDEVNKSDDTFAAVDAVKGSDRLKTLVETDLEAMYPKRGVMGELLKAETPEDVQLRTEATDKVNKFGRNALLTDVRRAMDDPKIAALKQSDPNAYKIALDDAAAKALARTKEFGMQVKKAMNEGTTAPDEAVGEYASALKAVASTAQAVDSSKVGQTPQDVQQSFSRLSGVKQDLANRYRYAVTDKDKAQALNAMNVAKQSLGYSPDEIINGKDEYGIPVDASKVDPVHGIFFRSLGELQALKKEYTDTLTGDATQAENTKLVKLQQALKVEDLNEFLTQQLGRLVKRTPPSIDYMISNPNYPQHTKVNNGVPMGTPSLK